MNPSVLLMRAAKRNACQHGAIMANSPLIRAIVAVKLGFHARDQQRTRRRVFAKQRPLRIPQYLQAFKIQEIRQQLATTAQVHPIDENAHRALESAVVADGTDTANL